MHCIPQLDETDCGTACLAMVARHHQSHHSLTTIRAHRRQSALISGTDRVGTNLADLVKAGQARGFDTEAKNHRGELSVLLGSLLAIPDFLRASVSLCESFFHSWPAHVN